MTDRLQNLDEALRFLCEELGENAPAVPSTLQGKQQLLRALMNVREPLPTTEAFLRAQDEELSKQRDEKGIVEIKETGLVLWQGDITRLKVDAIVNAANSQMLGCFARVTCVHRQCYPFSSRRTTSLGVLPTDISARTRGSRRQC